MTASMTTAPCTRATRAMAGYTGWIGARSIPFETPEEIRGGAIGRARSTATPGPVPTPTRVAMPSGPGPAPVIRRFGSNVGAGPSVRLPGRIQTAISVEAEAAAALAAGALNAVEEAEEVLLCTCSTGGF